MLYKILLADDEATFREILARVLREEEYEVATVRNGTEALHALEKQTFDVAILDIQMPGADGIKVLRQIIERRLPTRVIMISAYGTVEMAVEAIKLGACDYVMKPVNFDDILTKIAQQIKYISLLHENAQLREDLQEQYGIQNIIGRAPAMQPVFETIRKLANTRSNVLIVGESGTGKELIARAIHSLGTFGNGRFLAVNCSAITETLLQSELFGHKKGSFTGAGEDKKGLFEAADRGTLFLDEIGHMPLACQVKLLRAIEERKVLPVGSTEPVKFSLRIIAAMNKNPLQEVRAGHFREDLYYRLNVVGIYLPPLRERKEDIPLLVEHFISRYSRQMDKKCRGVTPEAREWLMRQPWQGNIRELQNVIERGLIFSEAELIPAEAFGAGEDTGPAPRTESDNLQDALKFYERAHLQRILQKYAPDKNAAAKALGVGLSSLYRKMDELDLNIDYYNRKRRPSRLPHPEGL